MANDIGKMHFRRMDEGTDADFAVLAYFCDSGCIFLVSSITTGKPCRYVVTMLFKFGVVFTAGLNANGTGVMGRPVVLIDNPAGNAIPTHRTYAHRLHPS